MVALLEEGLLLVAVQTPSPRTTSQLLQFRENLPLYSDVLMDPSEPTAWTENF